MSEQNPSTENIQVSNIEAIDDSHEMPTDNASQVEHGNSQYTNEQFSDEEHLEDPNQNTNELNNVINNMLENNEQKNWKNGLLPKLVVIILLLVIIFLIWKYKDKIMGIISKYMPGKKATTSE